MITTSTVMAAFKRLVHCKACGEPPEQIIQRVSMLGTDVEVIARCHGYDEVIRVRGIDIKRGHLGHALDQASELFRDHATPDVVELLRYNREPWRVAR